MPTEPPDEGTLSDLEAALGALRPRPTPARDRILFEAGRAAARPAARRSPFWPALAAGFGSIALGEAALLARRPAPAVVERVVVVREPAPAPVATVAPPSVAPSPGLTPVDRPVPLDAHHRLAERVARFGLDGLPPLPVGDGGPDLLPALSGRDLLRREIQTALSSGG